MFERNSLYRGRMPAKYFFNLINLALSSRVSKPVPSSISTRLSVGLWPGPRLRELMAVSTQSAPASIAFMRLTSVTPVVACTCT